MREIVPSTTQKNIMENVAYHVFYLIEIRVYMLGNMITVGGTLALYQPDVLSLRSRT